MNVIDKLKLISDTIGELINFAKTDDIVGADFNEYIMTIGLKNAPETQKNAESIPYIFERNINFKSIPELFLEKNQTATEETKNVVKGLSNATSSIFEVKMILKNGFELYNLVNEKAYKIISLTKMTNFRGLGNGQYVVARIFEYENEYYLIEISNTLASHKKEEALRYAIAKIIQQPELVYKDNPEKLAKIEEQVAKLYEKFIELFKKDEIIVINKNADDLINIFNDFAENEITPEEETLNSLMIEPETYKYFTVAEFNNSYDNFIENSIGGFSAHTKIYDVGIVFDKELGLTAVPFYGTFCKIFEVNDYKTIEGFDKCINNFLTTDGISANILRRTNEKYKNFMDVINNVLDTKLTFDELLKKYKPQYLKNKIFTSTTVLYESNVFSNTLGIIEENSEKETDIDFSNVGRNDLCPCGSGKKYKKCCGAAN